MNHVNRLIVFSVRPMLHLQPYKETNMHNFWFRMTHMSRNDWVYLNNWLIVIVLGVILVVLAAFCILNATW